jgi:hypothetical protein
LSEKDRRRYAAIEAVKLGYGGQVYIRRLFGCHHETLALGLAELEDEAGLEQEGIRQPGGCLTSTTLPDFPDSPCPVDSCRARATTITGYYKEGITLD